MPPAGFEHVITTSERPQTHVLDPRPLGSANRKVNDPFCSLSDSRIKYKSKKQLYRESGDDGGCDKIGEQIHGTGQRSTCK